MSEGLKNMKAGCRKVEENLIDFVENGLSEPLRDEIERHLSNCARCKRLVERFTLIWPDFSKRQSMAPSPSFWPGLLDKIQTREKFHRRGRKLLWGLKVSFRPAAVVLIFLLGIYFGYYLGNIPQAAASLSESWDMDTAAAEDIIVDPYFQDFQDFPMGSVADFYVTPRIQPQDKKP
jgi:hypothetical protein